MKKITFLSSIIFFVFACGGGSDTSEVSADALAKGKETFDKLCVACHGSDGEMSLNDAKKFSESTLSMEERILVITNGKNMMTPYKTILSEQEIKDVAAYTVELTNAHKK